LRMRMRFFESVHRILKTFELYEYASEDIGMICGGSVNVHFQYISADNQDIRLLAEAAADAYETGTDAWLVIDLSGHALMLRDHEKVLGTTLPDAFLDQLGCEARTMHLEGHAYYAEQLVYSDRVYIFGGGHVAQALVPVLSAVDFRCVVIEDRPEFCQRALFPQAQDVILLEEETWENALRIGRQDCICIMTRGHKNDLACQAYALGTQAGYIGVIGSKRKTAAVNAKLTNMGFTKEDIARIVTPIGLDIGAVTPAEIAVSIAAQMIEYRARSRKQPIQKSCMA